MSDNDSDDSLEGATGLPNYIRTKPSPPCVHEWEMLQDGSAGCRKCFADKSAWEAAQPAPDFEQIARAAARDAVVGLIIDGEPLSAEDTIFASIMKMRFGLAARSKVEDAEVATICKLLRAIAGGSLAQENKHDLIFNKAADLLERLAGDLADWKTLADAAKRSMEASDAKLAEREVELVNAYEELDWIARHDKQDMEFGPTMSLARKSVAARQQQKDKACLSG